jgi:cyclopropane fatty-acyl-phospholipid synthase-like methyltransferase
MPSACGGKAEPGMELVVTTEATTQTVFFYSHHPISSGMILSKLRTSRGHLDNVQPQELWAHDQDHFGGIAATDELVRQAGVDKGTHVVDFCAGLGGTVRYLAHCHGARVTGIELTPVRVAGAQELIDLVGLQDRARVIQGDVMDVRLADESADVVISQEALCHVPDLRRAMSEAFRILKRDGRLAFTSWIANRPLNTADAQLMWDGMAIQPLQSISSYRDLVESAGFRVLSTMDLTGEWGPILKDRLAMYQKLRHEARQAGTPAGHDAFHRSYIRFVELVQQGALGGIRLIAIK